jgi:hypothetical protein
MSREIQLSPAATLPSSPSAEQSLGTGLPQPVAAPKRQDRHAMVPHSCLLGPSA